MSEPEVNLHAAVADALSSFLRENILAPGVSFGMDTDLDALQVDSFALMEVVLFVERRFAHIIALEDINKANMATLRSITDLVCEGLIAGRSGGAG